MATKNNPRIDSFNSKKIYCNCDDLNKSASVRYFLRNFNELSLESFAATTVNGLFLYAENVPWSKKKGCSDAVLDIFIKENTLPLDGDFTNETCLFLLEEADVVVGNSIKITKE